MAALNQTNAFVAFAGSMQQNAQASVLSFWREMTFGWSRQAILADALPFILRQWEESAFRWAEHHRRAERELAWLYFGFGFTVCAVLGLILYVISLKTSAKPPPEPHHATESIVTPATPPSPATPATPPSPPNVDDQDPLVGPLALVIYQGPRDRQETAIVSQSPPRRQTFLCHPEDCHVCRVFYLHAEECNRRQDRVHA